MPKLHLPEEPSSTEVKGLTMKVEYERGEGFYSATLRHPALGSYTSHAETPTKARELAKQSVFEKFDELMAGHEQKHAHEVTQGYRN